MIVMILKMSAATALYVLLTVLIWKHFKDKTIGPAARAGIGVFYGLCSVLSTHIAIDYGHMLLNVRDIGPLAAGLIFDPLSGVIAGLIGGIERYIAGTWWGIGSYTRIACSVSTCLAGFFAMFMSIHIFKRKRPDAPYAFFMGAVMEVFHMYVILITHRSDMKMAYYVVRICSVPMILFTGLGLAVSAAALEIMNKEWRNPLKSLPKEITPLTRRFSKGLFSAISILFLINFAFLYMIKTQTAVQKAREMIGGSAAAVKGTYLDIKNAESGAARYSERQALSYVQAINKTIEQAGGFRNVNSDFLEEMRQYFNLQAVCLLSNSGGLVYFAGDVAVSPEIFSELTNGERDATTLLMRNGLYAAGAKSDDGILQIVVNFSDLQESVNLAELNNSLSHFEVGEDGSLDIFRDSGQIIAGTHSGSVLAADELSAVLSHEPGTFFNMTIFGRESMCLRERTEDGVTVLALMPLEEVYSDRDMTILEDAMSDILLLTVVFVTISFLAEKIVVNDLTKVNTSLSKITKGNLNETVDVRNSMEFAALSDGINKTVDALKGYIEDAKKRIEQELEFARLIQASALPRNFNLPRNDFEIFAMMDPAKEVGGDFYDFFFIDADRLALVIADVSGKGIPASLFMMRSKTAVRSFAESGLGPAEICFKANNTLCEGNDAEMFVTVWIGIIDLRTGLMKCANAGHEYPALMRVNGRFEYFKDKHSMPLAAMENTRTREYELQLDPGDKLFVFTDGIPEAINEQVEEYGPDRLLRKLNELRGATMSEMLPAIREDISDFAGKAEQFDDITMLGFVYKG